ncbi:MAG: sugar phosphate isomerase/epimerase [Lachnospiraceae bacterium]|nr:sugar phosphate isomerase/epimerase [Lachnospiraceae bacterium]
MKISVFYDHILQAAEQTGKPVPTLLRMSRQVGIDGVEINLDTLCENPGIPDMLREAGLAICCVYAFYDMGNRDEGARERLHIDMAKSVGAGCILVVPGFLTSEESEELQDCCEDYERTADFMERNESVRKMAAGLCSIIMRANGKGIKVTVEDFDGRTSPLSRMYGILWFLKNVPGLKFTLDMGNFTYSNEDVTEAYELLGDYVAHVHCKDRGEELSAPGGNNRGLRSVAVGDGYLPIAELVRKLQKEGYDGFLAIEHFDAPDQEACIRHSALFLRNLLKEK